MPRPPQSGVLGPLFRRLFLRHLPPVKKKRWAVACGKTGVTMRYKDHCRNGAERHRV